MKYALEGRNKDLQDLLESHGIISHYTAGHLFLDEDCEAIIRLEVETSQPFMGEYYRAKRWELRNHEAEERDRGLQRILRILLKELKTSSQAGKFLFFSALEHHLFFG